MTVTLAVPRQSMSVGHVPAAAVHHHRAWGISKPDLRSAGSGRGQKAANELTPGSWASGGRRIGDDRRLGGGRVLKRREFRVAEHPVVEPDLVDVAEELEAGGRAPRLVVAADLQPLLGHLGGIVELLDGTARILRRGDL